MLTQAPAPAIADTHLGRESCPQSHPLKPFYTPVDGYLCNRCGRTTGPLAKGTKMYACRTCDYDICINCLETFRPPALVPQGQIAAAPRAPAVSGPRKDVTLNGGVVSRIIGPGVEKLRELSELLENPYEVTSRSEKWFSTHDVTNEGSLGHDELKVLCSRLNAEYCIPPVDDQTVDILIKKFDIDDDGRLSSIEFRAFYSRLLAKIRDHYGYVKVRRDFFLDKSQGKPSDWYKVKKTIGQGSFGIVQLVEDKRAASRTLVLKTISKSKTKLSIEMLEQEIKNLRSLDHPNIIKVIEYYDDSNNIYIVMENADGGELLKVIEDNFKNGRYVNERWAMEVFHQVLEAISYCHSRSVMHKDLKAENIMLLDSINPGGAPHVVVIDFGLAEMFDDPSRRSRVVSGSPMSMAPEVWGSAVNKSISIGYKCDIYSLGCVIFHVLTGDFPVMAKTNEPADWLRKIKLGPKWSQMDHCSSEAIDLVKKMMIIDERLRPTARECLQHPWFKQSFRNNPEEKKPLLAPEQLKALIKYNSRNSFEKAVLMKIATSSKVSELSRVNKIFYSMDTENRGFIDRTQCATALCDLGLPREIAEQTSRSLDADGNNRIEYTELVAGLISYSDDHLEQMLWTVFTSLDRDQNGALDVHEIKRLLNQGAIHNIGLEANEKEIENIISTIDKDKSGTISFSEFKEYFLRNK